MKEPILYRINEQDAYLTEVNIKSHEVNDAFMIKLGEALENNTIVKKLTFERDLNTGPGFTKVGLGSFCRSLTKNTTLLKLDFSSNFDGTNNYQSRSDWDIWANEIAFLIENNHNIKNITLFNNMMTAVGIKPIAEALKYNKGLKCLDLSHNIISEEGGLLLAEAIEVNKTLEELDLKNCIVKDKGACLLAHALTINNTLLHINLFGNSITDQGGMALSDMLSKNTSLIYLDVNSYYSQQTANTNRFPNYFSDNVIESFLTTMKNNFTLEVLGIFYTNEDYFGMSFFRSDPRSIPGTKRLKCLEENLERNKKNKDSVFAAAENGELEKIKYLLNNGASFKASRKQDGMTPLHLALQNGHELVAKFLVGRGANLFCKNNRNQTPIDLAKNNGHVSLALNLMQSYQTVQPLPQSSLQPIQNQVSFWKKDFDDAGVNYAEAKGAFYTKDFAKAIKFFQLAKDKYKNALADSSIDSRSKQKAQNRINKMKDAPGSGISGIYARSNCK